MNWTRPLEILIETAVALWLFDMLFKLIDSNEIRRRSPQPQFPLPPMEAPSKEALFQLAAFEPGVQKSP